MSKKISLSTFPLQREYGSHKALEIAAAIGVDAVDFSLDLFNNYFDYRNSESIYSKSDDEIIEYFSNLRIYAQELGINICMTHGRGAGFKNIKEADEALIKNARLDCLATSVLGASVCVIHAVTTIYMGPDCAPELMRDLNYSMFTQILPYAKQYGIKIATETFGDAVCYNSCDFFGNINEFIMSYNRIRLTKDFMEYFTVCVDTGHSNKASRFNNNPSPADVIRLLGDQVTVLHLNDNDKLTDQHKIPMTGTIDWDDVFDALDEVGYSGYYNMELDLRWFGNDFMIESAEFAVKVMKNFLKRRYNLN